MKNLFLISFLFLTTIMFGQGKITGIVYDESGPLPGANITVEGTSVGTSSDFTGTFTIKSPAATGNIVVTFLGFNTKKVSFTVDNGGSVDLGIIRLKPEGNVLGEVVIKSTVVDIAKDRKTPVAVSTIKASEIQEKLGSQEFPEILKNTPSVYTSKAGGGFGDSSITVRGFDQVNTAVLINGVPVNDMENGRVFWSNWAGLSDVTSAMQVQRGLGSSKLAISSVGGTINVLTKTSSISRGGRISSTVGNDGYAKILGSFSTGKLKNGFSASVLFSRTEGDGYVDGTKFLGHNYFIGLGYEINDKHDLQFTFTGAPQWHHQKSNAPTIAQHIKYSSNADPDKRYNSDWGYLDGQEYNMRRNYYHKPIGSLNYDWKISDKVKLSSVFYGSWGRGGGSNAVGNIAGQAFFSDRLRNQTTGLIEFDKIYAYNQGQTIQIQNATLNGTVNVTRPAFGGVYYNNNGGTINYSGTTLANPYSTGAGITRINSVNSHDWYGGVINLNSKLGKNFSLDFGVDARTYKGYHFQSVNDLLGGTQYFDNRNINISQVVVPGQPAPGNIFAEQNAANPSFNPFAKVDNQTKIQFSDIGSVRWGGAFTQLEYSGEVVTAFIQGAFSNQAFRREDFFRYKSADALSNTGWKDRNGGNVKGGVNVNINEHNNFFVNSGYYSKQPFSNAVFPNNQSVVNENLTNEKVFGFELGYGYRSEKLSVNLNGYRTSWKDRFSRVTTNIDDDFNATTPTVLGTAFLEGIEQLHMGGELDFAYKPFKSLTINGAASYGDWLYKSDVVASFQDANSVVIVDPSGNPFTRTLFLTDVRAGNSAQTSYSIGAALEIVEGFKVDATYMHYDRLYANISAEDFTTPAANAKGSLQLPSYGLVDAGISVKVKVDDKNKVNLRFNMNNVLNKLYIAESRTNLHIRTQDDFLLANGQPNVPAFTTYSNNLKTYQGLDQANSVFFGFGRTWNFSATYNF